METLFGIPTQQLMWALLGACVAVVVFLGVSAARNPVALRLAIRNIRRRRAQSSLIVLGLMLASLLFSASLTTGDTLTNSIRNEALSELGEVDVVVRAETPEGDSGADAPPGYFDEELAAEVRDRLSDDEDVAGVTPLLRATVPLVPNGTGLSEPRVDVLGLEETSRDGFESLRGASGEVLPLNNLGAREVYLSDEIASGLDVGSGDQVVAFLPQDPVRFEVAGVYESGAHPASETSMVMPIGRLQELTGNEGRINEVLITHTGPVLDGAAHTDDTVAHLAPLLRDNDLEADPVKQEAIENADDTGEQFSSIFLLFAQFSIAAGVLLIFLIFVMLAAERRRELGILRAVGMNRAHLVRSFSFEGLLYAALASAVGAVLGVGVGWAMARIVGRAIEAGGGPRIVFSFSPINVLLAFALGLALTFLVVVLSSWRVSRTNVVLAIRNLPEPVRRRRGPRRVLSALAVSAAGAGGVWQAVSSSQAGTYLLGLSLLVVGGALAARILGLPDRPAFTLAGVALLALWLLPLDYGTGRMTQGISLFFYSGIITVLAGVWILVYNAGLLVTVIVTTVGNTPGLTPVVRTAVAYPMQNRFRTGMTLAMFSLVVFTLVTVSFATRAVAGINEDTDRFTGGFDLRVELGPSGYSGAEPGPALLREGEEANEIAVVGEVSVLPVSARQRDAAGARGDVTLWGLDNGYTENVGYGFAATAEEYDSAAEVWTALREEPGLAVVSASLVPERSPSTFGGEEPPLRLKGFYAEDEVIPNDVFLSVRDPGSGRERTLHVIGVLDDSALYSSAVNTSAQTLRNLAGMPIPPRLYFLDLIPDADAAAVGRDLERTFAESGLQVTVLREEVRQMAATNTLVTDLLLGFMALGLLVGIAALGVIVFRSVVERRQQIGVLRALGFQQRQVQLAFLLEAAFVALSGVALGACLGLGLSANIVRFLSEDLAGVTYSVPWTQILAIILGSLAASVLMTFLPARQASKVRAAEALRYDE